MSELTIGALLHDFGKLVYRAGENEKRTHGPAGYHRLKALDADFTECVLECVRYHHAEDIRTAALDRESLAYICYHADNLAAGTDRRLSEGTEESPRHFDRNMPLMSVFSTVMGKTESKYTDLAIKDRDMKIPKLKDKNACSVSIERYLEILNRVEKELKDSKKHSENSLLKILEQYTSFVPSSTNTSEIPDISLYQHSKLTAAYADCMYLYCRDNSVTDFCKTFYENSGEFNRTEVFAVLGCDVSGIQKFVYKVSSKGALQMLRGRSFYLEMLTETVIDEILEFFSLTRCNLIYSGGGRFYLLLPNLRDLDQIVSRIRFALDEFMLKHFGIDLYYAVDYVTASALDFGISKEDYRDVNNLFIALSKKLAAGKVNRYEEETLRSIFSKTETEPGARECSVCGTQSNLSDTGNLGCICAVCMGLYEIGKALVKKQNEVMTVEVTSREGQMPAFSMTGEKFIQMSTLDKTRNNLEKSGHIRVYSINAILSGITYSTNLWVGNYQKLKSNNDLLTFEDFAQLSTGIKRIGVLRADIDSLSLAFATAYSKEEKLSTLSRYAMLSSSLTEFFRNHINAIVRREAGCEHFFLSAPRADAGNVSIVYSGGDDLFIVGAWDEVLELGVDIYREFRKYTQGKLTLSAGFGMFGKSYPVQQMALQTGALEDEAKLNAEKTKDSVALFGMIQSDATDPRFAQDVRHVYKWGEFIDGVCAEKLQLLQNSFTLEENDKTRVSIGRGFLYHLLTLYRSRASGGDAINLARLAYLLARREPGSKDLCYEKFLEAKKKLYAWAQNAEDSRQLVTAITLMIYLNRRESDYE